MHVQRRPVTPLSFREKIDFKVLVVASSRPTIFRARWRHRGQSDYSRVNFLGNGWSCWGAICSVTHCSLPSFWWQWFLNIVQNPTPKTWMTNGYFLSRHIVSSVLRHVSHPQLGGTVASRSVIYSGRYQYWCRSPTQQVGALCPARRSPFGPSGKSTWLLSRWLISLPHGPSFSLTQSCQIPRSPKNLNRSISKTNMDNQTYAVEYHFRKARRKRFPKMVPVLYAAWLSRSVLEVTEQRLKFLRSRNVATVTYRTCKFCCISLAKVWK
jgi:hypothetical protein